jgi:tRNA A-37 threonylcarbamoyl transferase component Bud32
MNRDVLSNRYTLLEVLGDGGMARVYLARDDVLGRDVALKVLEDRYADDENFVERFRREAQHAASLNHPGVVQVYDQGRSEDGAYYMAMEYVPGGTLKERIVRGGPLDPSEAAAIGSRVADALAEAHRGGIVHRDVKPQNVLLGTSGEAKVADFGIARAASATTMTETNMVLGTASYMSPEQVRGERVGPQSDLYSLGVVLYEMLTGELPYEASDAIATAMKHLEQSPPHPREANPAVPEELDALVVRLLAKDPSARYPGAAELAEDLRRIRERRPPQVAAQRTRTNQTVISPARGASRGSDKARGSARRPLALVLVALLVGVVLLGGVAWALSRAASENGPIDAEGNPGGTALARVPDLDGLSPEEARRRLQGANLRLGSQEGLASGEAEQGSVVGQDPVAGTGAKRGSAVDVTVGTGPARVPAGQPSPTATVSASPTISPSASPASVGGTADAAKQPQRAAEDSAIEKEKAREATLKRAEELQKAREDAREGRQKVREDAREDRQKAKEDARKEAEG